MSGYFARLAQRSVSLATAARHAAMASPGVDIVEQNAVVDAPVTAAPRLDAPMARSTAAEAATASSASPVSSSADLPSRDRGETAALDSADGMQSPSAPIRGEFVERNSRRDEARPESSHGSASVAPTVDATPFVTETGGRDVDTAATEHATRKTTASPPMPARAATSDVREEGRARANDVPAPPSPAATTAPERQGVTAADRLRPRPRAGDVETRTSPVRLENGPAAGTRDVEVRIGAVRLEIHAPTPTLTAAPQTPPASNERPRFNPRRHFLRG